MKITIFIPAAILLTVSFLFAQDQKNNNDTETITLDVQKITVDPPKPQIALKVKEVKPQEYDFFRSFEDEVKAIPQDLLNIEVDQKETKIKNLNDILDKKRK